MRLEWDKWSSNVHDITFEKGWLVPWFSLTQSKSDVEDDEAGVKTMERMEKICARSSERR